MVVTLDPLSDGMQRGLIAKDVVQIGEALFQAGARRGCLTVFAEELKHRLEARDESVELAVLDANASKALAAISATSVFSA